MEKDNMSNMIHGEIATRDKRTRINFERVLAGFAFLRSYTKSNKKIITYILLVMIVNLAFNLIYFLSIYYTFYVQNTTFNFTREYMNRIHGFVITLFLPLIAMILVQQVYRNSINTKDISYLLTRPIKRIEIVISYTLLYALASIIIAIVMILLNFGFVFLAETLFFKSSSANRIPIILFHSTWIYFTILFLSSVVGHAFTTLHKDGMAFFIIFILEGILLPNSTFSKYNFISQFVILNSNVLASGLRTMSEWLIRNPQYILTWILTPVTSVLFSMWLFQKKEML